MNLDSLIPRLRTERRMKPTSFLLHALNVLGPTDLDDVSVFSDDLSLHAMLVAPYAVSVLGESGTEDPHGQQCCICRVVNAHCRARHSAWHLHDGEQTVQPV